MRKVAISITLQKHLGTECTTVYLLERQPDGKRKRVAGPFATEREAEKERDRLLRERRAS